MTIDKIKQLQKSAKISDVKLCAEAGISISTWWRYKNGKIKSPSYNHILGLLKAIKTIKEQKHVV